MEFYLYLPVQLVTSIKVSIPNGMEFYSIGYYIARGVTSFNSQRDGILLFFKFNLSKYDVVSIPNGMEFYFGSFFKMSEAEICFNSQRDGILRSPSL